MLARGPIEPEDGIAGVPQGVAFMVTDHRKFGTAPAAKPESAPPRSRRRVRRM